MMAHSPKYGLSLKFRTQDGGGRAIYKKGVYEERLTNYFLKKLDLQKGDVILDVGANIGWYSNFFSKHFPDTEIHSFEPDPENFEILLFNLKKNGSTSVIPNKLGVGKETETKQLYLYKKSNIGRHSMLDINEGPVIDIETVSLDEYVQQKSIDVSKIKFLKIDIEGYEYFAFLGAQEVLNHVPVIMAEFSPGYMRKGGVEPADLLHLLRTKGLKPFVINGLDLESIDDETLLKRDTNINLLWKRG